jgi:hypothetical protein
MIEFGQKKTQGKPYVPQKRQENPQKKDLVSRINIQNFHNNDFSVCKDAYSYIFIRKEFVISNLGTRQCR